MIRHRSRIAQSPIGRGSEKREQERDSDGAEAGNQNGGAPNLEGVLADCTREVDIATCVHCNTSRVGQRVPGSVARRVDDLRDGPARRDLPLESTAIPQG